MFDNEIVINDFQLRMLARIAADIPEAQLFQPGAGHGHPPAWILGHLAICGEIGQKFLGGKVVHPRWLVLFGPGSSDRIAEDVSLTHAILTPYSPRRTRTHTPNSGSWRHVRMHNACKPLTALSY